MSDYDLDGYEKQWKMDNKPLDVVLVVRAE